MKVKTNVRAGVCVDMIDNDGNVIPCRPPRVGRCVGV